MLRGDDVGKQQWPRKILLAFQLLRHYGVVTARIICDCSLLNFQNLSHIAFHQELLHQAVERQPIYLVVAKPFKCITQMGDWNKGKHCIIVSR